MIRQYDAERQIPDEIVMKIIKNAHRAPSAGHTEVQEFVIVKNPTIKKKLLAQEDRLKIVVQRV